MSHIPHTDRAGYLADLAALRHAAAAYYADGTSPLDDTAYDELMRSIAATEAAHPDWADGRGPASALVAAGSVTGDVTHAAASLSLANVFDDDELAAFLAAAARLAGADSPTWCVEPKLDGLACLVTVADGTIVRLATRGDGTAGEDITHALPLLTGLPDRLPSGTSVELRGEVVMSRTELARANLLREQAGKAPYANTRNAAAGALRAREHAVPVTLEFHAYGAADLPGGGLPDGRAAATLTHTTLVALLEGWGVRTASGDASAAVGQPAGTLTAGSAAAASALVRRLAGLRDQLPFDIDGLVVKADDPQVRAAAGATSHSPRWAVAYKLPAEQRLTTLRAIDVQVGRTGRITPVAKVDPVTVGGVTVTSATLNNFAHLARLDARVGDRVWIRRAGEVIPEVVSVDVASRPAGTEAHPAPDHCPRCGATLDRSQEVWRCPRGRDCGRAEAICWWASRDCLDVEGLGPAAVTALMDSGLVADVPDLYRLSASAVAALDGYGDTSAAALLAQLDAARTKELHRFVAALGVPMMGRRLARRLAEHFGTLAAIRAASADQLAEVDGIGPGKSEALRRGLADASSLVDALLSAGFAPAEPGPPVPGTGAQPGGPLAGRRVCVSGAVPGHTRASAEDLVRSLGGTPTGTVSKATGLLVAGDGSGSKLAKAAELGIEVWTPGQLLAAAG